MALTFTELTGQLDKALTDVRAKKAILEKAIAAAQSAQADYNTSLDSVRTVKASIQDILETEVPEVDGNRVR